MFTSLVLIILSCWACLILCFDVVFRPETNFRVSISSWFFLPHQAGHEEEVDLGDCTRKRITRAMKPLLFGEKHDPRKQRKSDLRLSTFLRISLPENLCGVRQVVVSRFLVAENNRPLPWQSQRNFLRKSSEKKTKTQENKSKSAPRANTSGRAFRKLWFSSVSQDLGSELAFNLIVLCLKTPVRHAGSEGEKCRPLVYVWQILFLLAS